MHARWSRWLAIAVIMCVMAHFFTSWLSSCPPRFLIVEPKRGLGNRLRAIMSACALAASIGRQCAILWTPDEHLNATFTSLFQAAFKELDTSKDVARLQAESDFYDQLEESQKFEPINAVSTRHIWIRTSYKIRHPLLREEAVLEVGKRFVPQKRILQLIPPNLSQHYGLHIRSLPPTSVDVPNLRSGEYSQSSLTQLIAARASCSVQAFTEAIQKVINADPGAKFFLSSDNTSAVETLKQRFPDRIHHIPRSCYGRDLQCLYIAVADLWALSQCKKILGSYWSSFGEVAGLLGGRKFQQVCALAQSSCKFSLVTSFPTTSSKQREREYLSSLRHNVHHPQVCSVHILSEEPVHIVAEILRVAGFPSSKLVVRPSEGRPTYKDLFSYASRASHGSLVMVVNADVILGDGFAEVTDVPPSLMLAISRQEFPNSSHCGPNACASYKNSANGVLSHDAWLFKAPLPVAFLDAVDFYPNLPGAENVVIHELRKAQLRIANPCISLVLYHNHCSGIREHNLQGYRDPKTRFDLRRCGTWHCGDGYCMEGPVTFQQALTAVSKEDVF